MIAGASRIEISDTSVTALSRPRLKGCVETPQTVCADASKTYNAGASPHRGSRFGPLLAFAVETVVYISNHL